MSFTRTNRERERLEAEQRTFVRKAIRDALERQEHTRDDYLEAVTPVWDAISDEEA